MGGGQVIGGTLSLSDENKDPKQKWEASAGVWVGFVRRACDPMAGCSLWF